MAKLSGSISSFCEKGLETRNMEWKKRETFFTWSDGHQCSWAPVSEGTIVVATSITLPRPQEQKLDSSVLLVLQFRIGIKMINKRVPAIQKRTLNFKCLTLSTKWANILPILGFVTNDAKLGFSRFPSQAGDNGLVDINGLQGKSHFQRITTRLSTDRNKEESANWSACHWGSLAPSSWSRPRANLTFLLQNPS